MNHPDRIRLPPQARLTLLRSLRLYIQTLLSTPDSERNDWPEAMDAWKLARSLAERVKGRRQRWGADWFYSFDREKPVRDLDEWISDLLESMKGSPRGEFEEAKVIAIDDETGVILSRRHRAGTPAQQL